MTYRYRVSVLIVALALLVAACGGAAPTATPAVTAKPAVAATTVPATATVAAPLAAATATKATIPTATTAAAQPTATTAAAPTATTAPKPVATATPAAPQAPAGNTPDVIANAQRAMIKQKAVRMTTSVTLPTGQAVVNLVEYLPPDRVRMSNNGTETIAIRGKGAWRKTATGAWQVVPGGDTLVDTLMIAFDPSNIDTTMANVQVESFKSLGADVVDGKPMRVYQYATSMKAGDTTTSSVAKVWIGLTDSLPYKIESDIAGDASSAAGGKVQIVYAYDPSIKIEPPM
jgi:hypothetical protein